MKERRSSLVRRPDGSLVTVYSYVEVPHTDEQVEALAEPIAQTEAASAATAAEANAIAAAETYADTGDAAVGAAATAADAALLSTDTTKVLRISAWQLHPVAPVAFGDTWSIISGRLTMKVGEVQDFIGALPLPEGVTIQKFRARLKIGIGSGSWIARLTKETGDETGAHLASISTNSAGWQTYETTGIGEVVGTESLMLFLSGDGGNDSLGDIMASWFEVEYFVPDLVKTV